MPKAAFVHLDQTIRVQLFTHLGAMEQAGVPVERALASLNLPAQADSALNSLRKQLAGGSDIASAGLRAGLLSPLDSNLIGAAQASGSLATVYRRLAERYRHKAQQAAALKSRMLMPMAVLILALFIQPLPALVGGQLSILGYLWVCLWPLLLLAGLYHGGRQLLRHRHRSTADGRASDSLLLRLPLFGVAYARSNVRDFVESLGLMLEAGMSMLEALPKACATLGSIQLRGQFVTLSAAIERGQSLTTALAPLEFPGKALLLGSIRTGEASGTLPASLLRHADMQSRQLDDLREQWATWLPRLFYAAVMLWMAYGLLSGGGFGPRLPAELG
jgi:general secretion pathway protein F